VADHSAPHHRLVVNGGDWGMCRRGGLGLGFWCGKKCGQIKNVGGKKRKCVAIEAPAMPLATRQQPRHQAECELRR
jgi:hypothetical protein